MHYFSIQEVFGLFFSYPKWIILIFGLCIGSFLNVCIYRIPKGIFFQRARSYCTACEKPIPFWLNIPVFSFLLLKGRSFCCNTPISLRYLLVELLTGALFVLFYQKFPFLFYQNHQILWDISELLRFFHSIFFASLLLVCSFIDFELKIIPDVISLPMIAFSPLLAFFHPELSLKDSFYGILLGAFVIYFIAYTYFLIRREEGIGMGDAKLLAAIGGWLGYQAIFPSIVLASLIGSLAGMAIMVSKRQFSGKLELPFGPFLSFGAILYIFFGPRVLFFMF